LYFSQSIKIPLKELMSRVDSENNKERFVSIELNKNKFFSEFI